MQSPLVSIIIVNWDEKNVTKRCLLSLRNNTDYSHYETILIDNGSADNSVHMVKKHFRWVKVIENPRNLGFSRAVNQGISISKGEYIVILNNDMVIIDQKWLEKLVKTAKSDAKIGIVGYKLFLEGMKAHPMADRLTYKGVLYCTAPTIEDKTIGRMCIKEVVSTLGLIKRTVVRRIGMFDEGFSPAYYEDVDYCIRTHLAGFRVVRNSEVPMIHCRAKTIKKKFDKNYLFFIIKKNQVRFMLLNFPLYWLIARIPYEIKSLHVVFFEKKNERLPLSLKKIKIRKNWEVRVFYLLKAYLTSFKSLKEIISKRRNRTMRIWYNVLECRKL